MARNKPFTGQEFERIYSRVPRLCVDLVIRDRRGIWLTLRQKNGWSGLWHLPGGTVYLDETVIQAVHRVAGEELGIEIAIEKELGYLDYRTDKEQRGFGHSISLVFLCRPLTDDIRLDDQVAKIDYFSVLPDNLIPEQKEFLRSQK